jgi:hypothetical protein
MRRLITVLALSLLLSAATVPIASAGAPSRGAEPPGRMLGIVPVLEKAKGGGGGAKPTRSNNLTYHNGPVMAAGNRVYTIFWGAASAWESGYISTINTYFANVVIDAGKTSNVYYSDTQYSNIDVKTSWGGTANDTNAYPASGCTDKATSICLTDAQLQAEIQAVRQANGWPTTSGGVQSLFFIFTPKGVGSCYGSSCAYTSFCAYHSWTSGSNPLLYANQPYAAQGYQVYTCDSGQHPNANNADATLNVVSHEHNEAITDPQGSAWYDRQGYENGDKCAWNFGTALGTVGGAKYNQVINGAKYYLQQEWSNQRGGCVLTGL